MGKLYVRICAGVESDLHFYRDNKMFPFRSAADGVVKEWSVFI